VRGPGLSRAPALSLLYHTARRSGRRGRGSLMVTAQPVVRPGPFAALPRSDGSMTPIGIIAVVAHNTPRGGDPLRRALARLDRGYAPKFIADSSLAVRVPICAGAVLLSLWLPLPRGSAPAALERRRARRIRPARHSPPSRVLERWTYDHSSPLARC
jgi:hypothetical protein